jgi:hydroxyacylglutathione hydrolase
MKVEQIYTGCLAQGAYYIESRGEMAIIDPLREIQPYLDFALKHNAKIKYIFETHFHADFVSGHKDLAEATGATIVYGPTGMKTGFEAYIGTDGEIFPIGNATIQLLHTPGHTMESSCFLLKDESGKEHSLFTGDTLFIGDVGRPDLAQHVISEMTQEKLAGHLYDSLRNKIMPLADHIIVYPGHGAGSACGKNMSKETQDTLGNQKKNNYALRGGLTKEQFIQELLTGLTPPPSYFPKNVLMNINGYDNIKDVHTRGTQALSPDAFETAAEEEGAIIIDTRKAEEFTHSFIPNSINIGIDGSFAVWVGTLITDIKQKILLVCEPGREEEVITRLARVGYDHCIGFLKDGFKAWKDSGKETESIVSIDVETFAKLESEHPEILIADVRKKSEFDSEHIVQAINAPLDYINDSMLLIDKNKTYYVHCAGGYRSMVFISILKARGYDNLINIAGGFNSIKASNQFKITDYVCPSTLL